MRALQAIEAEELDVQGRLREATDGAAGLPAMAACGRGWEVKTIVSLDLATVTGFAVRKSSGLVESGAVNFAGKPKDHAGVRWANFRRFLVELKQANPDIDVIHYEQVRRHVSCDSAHCYGALKALLELFCFNHQIELKAHGVGTWKKKFCGNGAAKKPEIIALCRELGFKPVDSNEADAIGILHVAIDRCPLLTPSPPPKKARPAKAVPATMDGQPF